MVQETAQPLKGAERRRFLAQTVQAWGAGGQRRAERELGWSRVTIRKGLQELTHGLTCVAAFCLRGRKPSEHRLPNLLSDSAALVDAQSQIDPQFRSTRLYTRLTAAGVRRQLIALKGYRDDALPSVRTIATKLDQLGYHLSKVAKVKPKKRFAHTDAIFERVAWRGVPPVVPAVTTLYRTGVKLSKDAMRALERCFTRDPQLGKWFVTISPDLLPG